jgi:hypothetical protein
MTAPDERLPFAGTAEPVDEHDPEAAEEYAESVGIDPAPDEVQHYRELLDDPERPGAADGEPPGQPG